MSMNSFGHLFRVTTWGEGLVRHSVRLLMAARLAWRLMQR